jgi:hypothetical protein
VVVTIGSTETFILGPQPVTCRVMVIWNCVIGRIHGTPVTFSGAAGFPAALGGGSCSRVTVIPVPHAQQARAVTHATTGVSANLAIGITTHLLAADVQIPDDIHEQRVRRRSPVCDVLPFRVCNSERPHDAVRSTVHRTSA